MSESGSSRPAVAPLPKVEALVRDSQRLAEIDGLTEQALWWHAAAPARRRELSAEAKRLATPRIWHDTISSLASTGWRMASAAAPDAPIALIAAASAAVGLRVEPPQMSEGRLVRAKRLVKAGGPAYVKLGQFIASADGLLPPEWIKAFAWCRDEAPPLRPGVAQRVLERELGDAAKRITYFDPQPLAAGSIGQVHRARLDDGTEVVVKVRRPKLRRRFRADIETLAIAAAGTERFYPAARAAGVSGFVELFADLSLQELDFRLEAANLVDSIAIFEALGADHIRAPRPIPGLVTDAVLVMEFMPGVSYAKLTPGADIDGDAILRAGIQGVLETTLRFGVFHGDLHAGNVLINEDDGTFSLVDFGIAGRLDAQQRAALIQYLAAFAASDARAQVDAMQAFGAINPGANTERLISELQVKVDAIRDRADGEITFEQLGQTLAELLQVMAKNGFRMPTELVLFFKNLLYLGSFAAGVAPEADVMAVVMDILAELFIGPDAELAALLPAA